MPFQPGQSGNPGGRPAESSALKKMAREHAVKAVAVLVSALDDEDARIRVAAASAILDRGFGKPAQAIVGGDADDSPIVTKSVVELVRNTG